MGARGAAVVGALAGTVAELGGEDDIVTAAGERVAETLSTTAKALRVEELMLVTVVLYHTARIYS